MASEPRDPHSPPKRCRTAYNIFYQDERLRILDSIPDRPEPKLVKGRKTHGKIGFQDLAKTISAAWKALPLHEKDKYVEIARKDKDRYLKEKQEWHESVAELERQHSREPLDYSMLAIAKKTPHQRTARDKVAGGSRTFKSTCSYLTWNSGTSRNLLSKALVSRTRVRGPSPPAPMSVVTIRERKTMKTNAEATKANVADCSVVKSAHSAFRHRLTRPVGFISRNRHVRDQKLSEPLRLAPVDVEPLGLPCMGFEPLSPVEAWSLGKVSRELDKASIDFFVSRFA